MYNLRKTKEKRRSAFFLVLLVVSFLLPSFCFLPVARGAGEPPEAWNRTYSFDPTITTTGKDVAVAGNGVYLVGVIYTTDYAAFIRKYDVAGNVIWTRIWNISGNVDEFNAVKVYGNRIYAAGSTSTGGDTNTTLVCYDSDGNQKWNRTWGKTVGLSDALNEIAIYNSDNMYVAGYTSNSSSTDGLLLKYNSTGHLLWNQTWGTSSSYDAAAGVAIFGSNAVYLSGETQSYGPGGTAVFLARYDSSGNMVWNVTWGGDGSDYGRGVVTDSSHNIYVTGRTNSFGLPASDGFLVKFESTGQKLWNITFNSGGLYTYGHRITVDANGMLYIVGSQEEVKVLGITADIYIAQFDSSGNKMWNMIWGSPQGQDGYGVAVSGTDSIYISGYITGTTGRAVTVKFVLSGSTPGILFLILIFPLAGLGIALIVIYKRREEMLG